MTTSTLDAINSAICPAEPQHDYKGFACRFTGLKGRMDDCALVGQWLAVRGEQRFVVMVPSGYVGPYHRGDYWQVRDTYDLAEFDADYEAACNAVRARLAERRAILHRLIDQVLEQEG